MVVTEGETTIEVPVPPVLHRIPLAALVDNVTDCPAHSAPRPLGAEEFKVIKHKTSSDTHHGFLSWFIFYSTFSFNHPSSACGECRGFGRVIEIDLERAVPDLVWCLFDDIYPRAERHLGVVRGR